jgi:hypothetical protein
MNDYQRDDAWQREMRDTFLVPYYGKKFAGFVLLDKGPFARDQQRRGVDTLFWDDELALFGIEEKIVRYKDRAYSAICLETETCTKPGRIARGWMWYSAADYLLYGMQTAAGDLDCLWIDFAALHKWFWPREKDFRISVMADTINQTASRLVPIEAIAENVQLRRFTLVKPKADADLHRLSSWEAAE